MHAIGAGLMVIEIQQNFDLTYRLYDYGRPRELHLDDGVAVSVLEPFEAPHAPARKDLLADGPNSPLRLESGEHQLDLQSSTGWLVPVIGSGRVDCQPFHAGQCWSATGRADISLAPRAVALLAYPGPAPG